MQIHQFVGISCLLFCSSYGYVVDINSISAIDSVGDISEVDEKPSTTRKWMEEFLLARDSEKQNPSEVTDTKKK